MKKEYTNRVIESIMIVFLLSTINFHAYSASFANTFVPASSEFSMIIMDNSFINENNSITTTLLVSDKEVPVLFINTLKNNGRIISEDYSRKEKLLSKKKSSKKALNQVIENDLNNSENHSIISISKLYSEGIDSNIKIVDPVIVEVSNTCPDSTVNLMSYVNSTPPSGSVLSWHTGSPATIENKITDSQAMAVSVTSGPFYPAYYDASGTGCFSPTGSPIHVTITICCTITTPTLASAISQPTCNIPSGTINISPQTGSEYSVNNGTTYQSSPNFTGLAAGTYNLKIRSTINATCTASGTNAITINAVPSAPNIPTTASITQPTCSITTGEIVFTTQIGVEYSIDNGISYQVSTTFTGLSPGTYNLKVRSTSGHDLFHVSIRFRFH